MDDLIAPRLANCCNGACRLGEKTMEIIRKEGPRGIMILSPALDIEKADEKVMANCCNGAVDEFIK